MDVLRIFLFAGLLLHKLIWVLLKKQDRENRDSKIKRGVFISLIKLCKMGFLIFLLFQTLALDILPISREPYYLKAVGVVLFTIGFITAVVGRINLGRNWVDLEEYTVIPGQSVVSHGIYKYIRHPIYTGDLLLILGLELALNSWLFLLTPVLFIIVYYQAIKEENMLLNLLPGYAEYCARTRRFIPYLL